MTGSTLHAEAAGPGRLDQFWADQLAEQSITRSKIQEWIKAGLATVDGQAVRKSSHKLRGGERLELTVPEARAVPEPETGGIAVLYRDKYLAVVDKQPGLTVHPAPSCPEGTLVNRLLHHFPELKNIEGERPGIVHRIDKDTSGLLVVALSEPVRLKLSAAFAGREVKKTYLALVHGRPAKDEGFIDAPIGRDPGHKTRMCVLKGGREARSAYRVSWTSPDAKVSLVEVDIATGRTHQIRVHLAHLGHPLVGDALYGSMLHAMLKRRDRLLATLASRQMLHAWKLSFTHPATGLDMAFTCPPPRDFWRIPLYLTRTVQRVGVVGLPGSGKSAVMQALAERGWPVWSADRCVAELYEPGADGWHILRSRFGDRFAPSPGSPVDKGALLEAMRGSEGFRRELMEILYPLVQNRLEGFWQISSRSRAAFAEVPMLLEAGWLGGGAVDLAVGVRCPAPVRHERLAGKRGWDQDMIALVDSWQWPEEKKLAACRYTVDNSGTLEDLEHGVDAMLAALLKDRTARTSSLLAWMRANEYA
ncbi:dephospho-CoA kinase [Fundidesulfovibrio terrae]|uniref:dephospho-CoA kinase n=1 Tax=Fundidesulfovibrio terrae TaxID=2922866 RepID=UPI001FAEDB87|nr:dephospho-CoA kinase [Fundidesulfovibrio terrae]